MAGKIVVDIAALEAGLAYLKDLINYRIKSGFPEQGSPALPADIPAGTEAYLLAVLRSRQPDFQTDLFRGQGFADPTLYVAILLALVPHLNPHFFDDIIQDIFQKAVDFPRIGGVRGSRRTFYPTLETLQFVCGADKLSERLRIQRYFEEDAFLCQKDVLHLESTNPNEILSNSRLQLSETYLELFTLGEQLPPRLSYDFPARPVETFLKLQDLVLHEHTLEQFLEIEYWMKYGRELQKDDQLGKHLKKGYRALFYGPPGTGKTITAGVLGKRNQQPVYVIDLSMVVSKYIGETEKNLSNLLNQAENEDWILFFDEADALFGKRTNVKDAHDRFANQEIAYLLQRIEQYNGLVIMATNMKKNIDEAFLRRFQSVIHFPLPSASERLRLWQQTLPLSIPIAPDIDLEELAKKYKISGAAIVSVLQYSSLLAKSRHNGACQLQMRDVLTGIQREMAKDGRGMSE